jgi:hypothetical protein
LRLQVLEDNQSDEAYWGFERLQNHYDFKLSIERCKEQEKPERAMMIQTVEGIKRNFNKKEIDQANEAQRLYVILGRPSQKAFEDILKRGKLVIK